MSINWKRVEDGELPVHGSDCLVIYKGEFELGRLEDGVWVVYCDNHWGKANKSISLWAEL